MKKFIFVLSFVLCLSLTAVSQAQNLDDRHHQEGSVVKNRKYMTFGRNPMIPGGLTPDQARNKGWEPFQLEQDTYTSMYGASGERISGFIRSGQWMAWDTDGRLRVLACGNKTDIIRVLQVKTKTDTRIVYKDRVVYKDRDVPVPYPVVEYRDVPGETVYKYVYISAMLLAPQQQHIGNLPPPNVTSPVIGGISFGGGFGSGDISIENWLFSSSSASSASSASAAAAAAAGGKK